MRDWMWMRLLRGCSFFFNAHNNLLEEVAKFRAARRMWARIMREHFGAKKDAAGCCGFIRRRLARH